LTFLPLVNHWIRYVEECCNPSKVGAPPLSASTPQPQLMKDHRYRGRGQDLSPHTPI